MAQILLQCYSEMQETGLSALECAAVELLFSSSIRVQLEP